MPLQYNALFKGLPTLGGRLCGIVAFIGVAGVFRSGMTQCQNKGVGSRVVDDICDILTQWRVIFYLFYGLFRSGVFA